jgi:hypothetical protein
MIVVADYLTTARRLLQGSPSETCVRRAVSTAYYAMFHHLCSQFATVVLRSPDRALYRAWLQVYRFADHGTAKQRCAELRNEGRDFPRELIAYSQAFVKLQGKRIEADYDPLAALTVVDAESLINLVEQAVLDFDRADLEHQRAFVLFVCLKPKNR